MPRKRIANHIPGGLYDCRLRALHPVDHSSLSRKRLTDWGPPGRYAIPTLSTYIILNGGRCDKGFDVKTAPLEIAIECRVKRRSFSLNKIRPAGSLFFVKLIV